MKSALPSPQLVRLMCENWNFKKNSPNKTMDISTNRFGRDWFVNEII